MNLRTSPGSGRSRAVGTGTCAALRSQSPLRSPWRLALRDAVRLGLLGGLAAVAAGCERPTAATTDRRSARAGVSVARVETVRPARMTLRRTVEEPGHVEAFEETAIHARIAGYVKSWSVNIGSKITKGQVLAVLDVPEVEAEAEQERAKLEQAEARRDQASAAVAVARADIVSAEARVAEARAGIKRAGADAARWQSEFARVEQLFRERAQTGSLLDETRNKRLSAEAALEEIDAQVKTAEATLAQSRAGLDKARSDLAAAAAGVAVARSDVRHAETMLGFARIVAPFDGVVTRRNADTGHMTAPGAQGEPLFVVARADLVTIAVAAPEMFAAAVDPGDAVLVRLQALPGPAIEAKVTRTAYALDPKSRTLRVEVDVPNPDGKLHPGLYAYATIVLDERKDALTLTTTAVGRDGTRAYCMAIRDGHLAKLPIEVGIGDGARVEILSGLAGDEVVAKVNAPSLVAGQPVESTEPANPPASGAKP